MVVKGLPAPGVNSRPTVDRKPSYASSRDYSGDFCSPGHFLGEMRRPFSTSPAGTEANFGSGSITGTKKKKGWSRNFAKFLKESVGASMDVGFESNCDACGAKMKPNKTRSELVCPGCFGETASQIGGSEKAPW